MTGHGSKFGRKKEQAIAALISHRNIEDASKATGISPTTLKRWMRIPEFKAAYLQARREIVFQAHARIQLNSGAAASILFKPMADPATPPSIRARTAQCILEAAAKSLALEDIEVRVARLEETELRGRRELDQGGEVEVWK
jgi:transposase-like protein